MMTASPMSAAAVQAELAAIFAKYLHIDVPTPETDLVATGQLDSLGVVELLLQLEKHFGLRLDVEDLEIDPFRSLATLTAFILTHRSGGH
jgi:acyl carrier protein